MESSSPKLSTAKNYSKSLGWMNARSMTDVDPIGTCPRKPRNYELDYKTRKLKEKLEEDNDQETRNPNKHTFQKTLGILNPTPNGNRLKNSKYRTQESINPLCQVVSSQEYKIASTLTK